MQPTDDSDTETIHSGSQDTGNLPSNDPDDFIEVDEELLGAQESRYAPFLHEPAYVESQSNVYVTQIDQPWSSPTRIRGPRWRKKTPTPSPSPEQIPSAPLSPPRRGTSLAQQAADVLVAEDFDDEEIEALLADDDFESVGMVSQATLEHPPAQTRPHTKHMRQTTLFGRHTTQTSNKPPATQSRAHNWRMAAKDGPLTHHKINEKAMETWIFPLNVGTVRDYQYNIVHKSLFNNILVALPTGLGKTFIAATVMMNWYNWTKDAQLVFMAPTKPLVAQQIEACFHIAGIPRSQTTLMTGEIPAAVRADEWQTKRVFFMTPQTFANDLKTGIADPKKMVLVVMDEAHKATGNYSYVDVVRFLRRFNNSFRVLALTATPGSNVEAVQKVIDGLDIARVEIRTEESLDIQAFVHRRNTELEVFDYSDEIKMCLDLFGKAVKPVLDKLCTQNAYWNKDPTAITTFGLLQAQKQWSNSEAGKRANWGVKGMLHACFQTLMSLAHNLDLLKYHGIGPFFSKMREFENTASSGGKKYEKMIAEHADFLTLMNRLRGWVNSDNFVGHPKLSYLNSVVLNHFMDAGNGIGAARGRPPSDTRIMIFAHWRDSAEEICRVLNRHQPMIRAHVFVGQSNTKSSEGMDQKTQTKVISEFKSGTYNTLVATCIGEEGLDIGEVDLIVCYDCSKSPIRMLQRMGRTGRKRAGNIVMLLMRGKEERDYYSAKDNYQKMQDIIESGRQFEFHDDRSPRIVPKGIIPVASKKHIEIPIENTQPGSVEPKKSKGRNKKKSPKKFHMPDNVETGFQFLGSKKKPSKMIPKKKILIDAHEALLSRDDEVLLTPAQELELEQRFASVAGEEPQFIEPIQVGDHPLKLRRRDKIASVGHSRTTNRLILASSQGRDRRYKDRPTGLPSHADEQEEPFWRPRHDTVPDASQAESLPDLGKFFEKQSTDLTSRPRGGRSRRHVICDNDEDD